MFNEAYSSSKLRARGALEITANARAAEKAHALAFGGMTAEKAKGKTGRGTKGLISNLLAILHIG